MCVGERLNMQFLISEPLLGAGTILSHSNIPHWQPTYLILHTSLHTLKTIYSGQCNEIYGNLNCTCIQDGMHYRFLRSVLISY